MSFLIFFCEFDIFQIKFYTKKKKIWDYLTLIDENFSKKLNPKTSEYQKAFEIIIIINILKLQKLICLF